VLEFYKIINKEKCRSGIYITTSKFSLKAKSAASTRLIELLDANYLYKAVERVKTKLQKK
jgi:restriction endonuclease Mrr